MSSTVATDTVAAQMAALMARVETLEQGQDALDRGVTDAGVTASRALNRADDVLAAMRSVVAAAGLDEAQFTDPVASRAQARRRRIEASGFRLVHGGGEAP